MSAYTGLSLIESNASGTTLQVIGERITSAPSPNPQEGAASSMLIKACRAYPKLTACVAPAVSAIDCSYAPDSASATIALRSSIIGARSLSGNAVDIDIDLAVTVERLRPAQFTTDAAVKQITGLVRRFYGADFDGANTARFEFASQRVEDRLADAGLLGPLPHGETQYLGLRVFGMRFVKIGE